MARLVKSYWFRLRVEGSLVTGTLVGRKKKRSSQLKR